MKDAEDSKGMKVVLGVRTVDVIEDIPNNHLECIKPWQILG